MNKLLFLLAIPFLYFSTAYGFTNADYNIYQSHGYVIGEDSLGHIVYNMTSPTYDSSVLNNMIQLTGQKQGTLQVSGTYQMGSNGIILPDKVNLIGSTLEDNQGGRVPNFIFSGTGGFTMGVADKLIGAGIVCNDSTSTPCLTVTGNVNYIDQVRINAKTRDVGVQFGKGYSFGATNSNFVNSITIAGGKTGLYMFNNTQNYFGNVMMTSYYNKGVYFTGSDHNHFVNLFMASPAVIGSNVNDVEFGNNKYDLTLANQIDTLTVPPLDTAIKTNTAGYGSVRPNFIHVLGIDNSPNYIYTNGGYGDVVIDHTTIPFYQEFSPKYTPALTGLLYQNTWPYTMKIYQTGGTGVSIGTYSGGNFVQGGFFNIGNQNYFELEPGEKVSFITKPTSWKWYAGN